MALTPEQSLQLHEWFSAVTDFQQVSNAAEAYGRAKGVRDICHSDGVTH
jgi:hypothetical protein